MRAGERVGARRGAPMVIIERAGSIANPLQCARGLTMRLAFCFCFSQHLMKRIQRGPVRGISLKLQEEERERRMDFVPEKSALEVESIEVDKDTMDMLKSMNMGNLPGVSVSSRGGYSKGPRREPRA